jgi:mono/diheme cytochrome c family protein
VATVNVPATGEWKIKIESGFGPSSGKLLPLRAIDSTARTPVISEAERGRMLFAGKGCVTCHVHDAVPVKGIPTSAPELTERRFAPEYLRAFLANPSIKPPAQAGGQMPNLQLAPREIASLVAFINNERQVSAR